VRVAVEAARFSMETRGIEMEVDLSEGLPVIIHEPEAIQQVLQNLISNAAKYGEPGGWIGIYAKLGHNTVEIAVSDRGIGISDQDLPQIFEKFFRSESDVAQKQKGTGIGLTIVQYIMEAHHGAVRVKSSLGHGTTFTLHFPIRAPIASGL
jgi:signal transduction histidine kinase